jgi:hypothetical protein
MIMASTKNSSEMRLALCCVFLILIAIMTSSCAHTKPKTVIELKPKQIPLYNAKIYEAPGIDWRKNYRFTLELRELGHSDTVSNQILERYLSSQIEECMLRKGFRKDDQSYTSKVRLFFGVKEDPNVDVKFAYGAGSSNYSTGFRTTYPFTDGSWDFAEVAHGEWHELSVNERIPVYRNQISIEILDSTGNVQLWRGDIECPTLNDDIRWISNSLIRELIWNLPALDYPAIPVPEVKPEEFEPFWNNVVVGPEFYSPGQRDPLIFDYGFYETARSLRYKWHGEKVNVEAQKAAMSEFEKTQACKEAKRAYRKSHIDVSFEESKEYKNAFSEFVFGVWNQRETTIALAGLERYGCAIADLMLTAPWSIPMGDDRMVMAGRYYVGEDPGPVILLIEAKLLPYAYRDTGQVRYDYERYFITQIRVIPDEEYAPLWKKSFDYRERVFGRKIDPIPEEPTPAVRSS